MIKTIKEIEDELWRAKEWTSNDETDVFSMTYEQGVEAALEWVLGIELTSPIESDYSEETEIEY